MKGEQLTKKYFRNIRKQMVRQWADYLRMIRMEVK